MRKKQMLRMAKVKMGFVEDQAKRILEVVALHKGNREDIPEWSEQEIRARIEIMNQRFHEFAGIMQIVRGEE